MTEATDNGLARRLVTVFDQRRTVEFAQIAETISCSGPLRTSTEKGLIDIARAETSFEDIHTRDSAIKIIDLLGFSHDARVRHELFGLFTATFSREKLAELARFEALPKTRGCGRQCSELRLLHSLLRSLLRVNEEPGLTAARLALEAFAGTDFARKIARLLDQPSE